MAQQEELMLEDSQIESSINQNTSTAEVHDGDECFQEALPVSPFEPSSLTTESSSLDTGTIKTECKDQFFEPGRSGAIPSRDDPTSLRKDVTDVDDHKFAIVNGGKEARSDMDAQTLMHEATDVVTGSTKPSVAIQAATKHERSSIFIATLKKTDADIQKSFGASFDEDEAFLQAVERAQMSKEDTFSKILTAVLQEEAEENVMEEEEEEEEEEEQRKEQASVFQEGNFLPMQEELMKKDETHLFGTRVSKARKSKGVLLNEASIEMKGVRRYDSDPDESSKRLLGRLEAVTKAVKVAMSSTKRRSCVEIDLAISHRLPKLEQLLKLYALWMKYNHFFQYSVSLSSSRHNRQSARSCKELRGEERSENMLQKIEPLSQRKGHGRQI